MENGWEKYCHEIAEPDPQTPGERRNRCTGLWHAKSRQTYYSGCYLTFVSNLFGFVN